MGFLLFMETKRKHFHPPHLPPLPGCCHYCVYMLRVPVSLACLDTPKVFFFFFLCLRKLFYNHNWKRHAGPCIWPLRTKAGDQQPLSEEGRVEVFFLLTGMKQTALSVVKIKQPVHFLWTLPDSWRAGRTGGHFSFKRRRWFLLHKIAICHVFGSFQVRKRCRTECSFQCCVIRRIHREAAWLKY